MTATAAKGQTVEVLLPVAVAGPAAGRLIGVSARTWHRMDQAGLIPRPSIRVGSRIVRWSVAEIGRWIEAGAPGRVRWELLEERGERPPQAAQSRLVVNGRVGEGGAG